MEKLDAAEDRLVDIAEASQRLGISVNTVYSWVNQRKIPFVKVGRLVRFDPNDLRTWIAERKVPTKEFLN